MSDIPEEHGTGNWGVVVKLSNGRKVIFWSPTERERDADYSLLTNKNPRGATVIGKKEK